MTSNKEQLSEREICERILEIEEKIDEALADSERADMDLIDEYIRQIRELDGTPEKTKEEMEAEMQIIYSKAAVRKERRFFRWVNDVGKRAAAIFVVIGIFSLLSAGVYAAGVPLVEFLSNKYVEIFFDSSDVEKAPSVIETVYTLGYVPEGYVEKDCAISKISTN